MIRIISDNDLESLKKLSMDDVFKSYIENYYFEMLNRFDKQSLSGLGSIFVLDSADDVIKSKFEDFITKNPPYRTVGLTLYDGDTPIYITHILLFINNGYAVNIFVEEQHVKDIISNYYKSEVS